MRMRLIGVLAAVPLAVAVALAGCASGDEFDGIATAGGSANPSASASASPSALSDEEAALKFAQCMREHGVDMPDPKPDSGGEIAVRIQGGDRTKVDAAMQACRQYAPNGGQPRKPDPQMIDKLREMSKCMRENGVPNFPDPNADGGIMLSPDMGINPRDPKFQAAQEKCRQEAGLPKPDEVTAG